MRTETKGTGTVSQGLAIDQFGARFGEHAFIVSGKLFVKFLGENKTQDGIPKELQTLVMASSHTALMRDGRMGERQAQEIFVAKFIGNGQRHVSFALALQQFGLSGSFPGWESHLEQ